MKISFSTLGCPDWKWSEIVSTAKDLGYDGVEIRGLGADLYAPDIKLFSDENVLTTKKELEAKGLEISCLASACCFNLGDKDYIKEAKEYVLLGEKLGAKGIRILGDNSPEPGKDVDDALVISRFKELCNFAEGKDINILLETNGVYSDSERTLKIINAVNSENFGVLWDIQHPIRNYGEESEKTYDILKPFIKHIHIKDSVVENGKTKYKMLGYGDLPVRKILSLLKKNDFKGYLSLEWVKRWNKELEDPGIVFEHFIRTVKSIWQTI